MVDLGKKLLEKNSLLLAYTHDAKHSVFLRANNEGWRKQQVPCEIVNMCEVITANYVNKINDESRLGLEVFIS